MKKIRELLFLMFLSIVVFAASGFSEVLSKQIDFRNGQDFSKEIFGISLPFDRSNYHESDPTAIRGVSSGLYGDTYDWKNHVAIAEPGTYNTTLRLLERCRDFNAEPLIQVNWRGIVSEMGGEVTDTNIATLVDLAEDWVTYCNFVAPFYQSGDVLPPEYQTLIDGLDWGLAPTLSDVNDLPPAGVNYWIIGNEPASTSDAAGGYWCDSVSGGTLNYKSRYIALTTAILETDPTVKVGPGAHLGYECVTEVLQDTTNCHIDFLDEHIYPMLGDYWPNASELVMGPSYYIPDMENALMGLNSEVQNVFDNLHDDLLLYGRNPDDYDYVIGEWNPCIYETEATYSMYQALAVAEMLFTFMEAGVDVANFWSHMSDYNTQTLYPSYFVMNELRKNSGDMLVDVYRNGSLRIYSTKDSSIDKAAVWILNFDNEDSADIALELSDLDFDPASVLQMTLSKISGSDEPLLAKTADVSWQGDYVDNFDGSNHSITVLPASVTMLVLKGRTANGLEDVLDNRSGIESSRVKAINNDGKSVGNYVLLSGKDGYSYTKNWGFTYSDAGFDSPYSYPAYTKSAFYGVNNRSIAIAMQQGWGGETPHGFTFDLKTGLWLDDLGEGIIPNAINDNNIIAGELIDSAGEGCFILDLETDVLTELGTCDISNCEGETPVIYGINNDNVIVGGVAETVSAVSHSVIYRPDRGDGWIDIGSANNSGYPTALFDINDNGIGVGFSNNLPFYTSDLSVDDANDIALYALDKYINEDNDFSRTFALGINNSGVIVGMSYTQEKDPDGAYSYQEILAASLEMAQYAVIWDQNRRPINLNSRVLDASGWDLRQAYKINDSGVIAANAIDPYGRWRGVLLYPEIQCSDNLPFYRVRPIGDFGGVGGSRDYDCRVDIYDLEILVSSWMNCSNPLDSSCDQYWKK